MTQAEQDRFYGYFFPAMFLTIGAGALVLCYQGFVWLRDGVWTPLPIGGVFGLSAEGVAWRGAAKLIDLMLSTGLSAALVAGAFLAFLLVEKLIGEPSDRKGARKNS